MPPQFVELDGTATKPRDPSCLGYSFVNWYKGTDDGSGTIVLDDDPFDFDTEIEGRTTLYAKWTPNEQANYTIIIWKQNVNDNKNAADSAKTYDFAESVQMSGNVGNIAGGVTATGTGNNR